MAPINYTPQTWANGLDHKTPGPGGTPVTAARLTYIETGVKAASDGVDTLDAGFEERVRDAVAAALVAGENVTIDVNDAGNTITISSFGGGGGSGASLYGDGLYGEGLYGQASTLIGGGAWGEITGTLSSQTDLQEALDAKADDGHTHPPSDLGTGSATSSTFLRGDGVWAVPAGGGGGVGFEVFEHGTNAAAIRPVTANFVVWVGSVQPTNWINGDQWINATPL